MGFGQTDYDVSPISYIPSSETYPYQWYNQIDIIGAKWIMQSNPDIDYLWYNMINTRYSTASGGFQTHINTSDTNLNLRVGFNNMVGVLVFATDWFYNPATPYQGNRQLSYFNTEGAVVCALSDYTTNALKYQFHCRQDYGGHLTDDKLTLLLWGNGRMWVKLQGFVNNFDAIYNSIIRVDYVAGTAPLTAFNGQPDEAPAKLAAWQSSDLVTAASGDATYTHSYMETDAQTAWSPTKTGYPSPTVKGYEAETHCYNDFRRSNNQILIEPVTPVYNGAYSNTPFCLLPWWNNNYTTATPPYSIYNIQRQQIPRPYSKFYRTIALVRGSLPYVVTYDQVQKVDNNPSTFTYTLQMPTDVTFSYVATTPSDVIFTETATTARQFLVRVIYADGTTPTPPQIVTDKTSAIARNRLEIVRTNSGLQNFMVLLFPYTSGTALPVTTYNTTTTTLTLVSGGDTDTIQFLPNVEFTFARNGVQDMNYTNVFEAGPTS